MQRSSNGTVKPATLWKRNERARNKERQNQFLIQEKLKATEAKASRVREQNKERQAALRSRRKLPDSLKDACADHPAFEKLKSIPIFDSSYPPSRKIQASWGDFKVPQLFPIDECIVGEPPSHTDLFHYISAEPDISDVLAQAFQKDEIPLNQSLYAANIPIPSPPWEVVLPLSFKSTFTVADPSVMSQQSLNLSNKNSLFEFHIDDGLSGISICTSEKIWMFAPLSDHNRLVFMEQEEMEHDQILPESIYRMEKLIMIKQTPTHAILLHTGDIHCTIATAPGIVYGIVWETVEDVHIMARCFPGLFPVSDAPRRKYCVKRFNKVLIQALENNSTVRNAVASLCDLLFHDLVRQNRRIFAETITIFKKHFRQKSPRWNTQDLCPCKDNEDLTTTIKHIKVEHVDTLDRRWSPVELRGGKRKGGN